MADLNDLVSELARARVELAGVRAQLEALMANDAIVEAQAYERSTKMRIAELENAIREAALKEYAENGNKRPHSAIAVRINKRLRYDVNAALEYCRKHFDAAVEVVLNTKVFEKAAKAAPNLDLDFVQVVEEPQATIASDLTPYLPAE